MWLVIILVWSFAAMVSGFSASLFNEVPLWRHKDQWGSADIKWLPLRMWTVCDCIAFLFHIPFYASIYLMKVTIEVLYFIIITVLRIDRVLAWRPFKRKEKKPFDINEAGKCIKHKCEHRITLRTKDGLTVMEKKECGDE